MSALVDLRGVRRDYRMGEVTVQALRGIDLAIPAAQFVVLLGPSGSGKTTTLNLLGGLDRPSAGRVIVAGEDISEYDAGRLTGYRRRSVGFVFQFFNLIPTLSASENVEFALALSRPDGPALRERARELLGLVGLAERADHFPAQLSGGEQQRVAIARALANEPPLILCDEPTGDLDSDTGRAVLRVLRTVNERRGATVVLVTHNSAIAQMADRVVRLRDGSIDGDEISAAPTPVERIDW